MIDYPKQDHEIILHTTDNSRITGMINVLGRSISNYLQGPEPDIILYNCMIDEKKEADTLMISKDQILWINSKEKPDAPRLGNWQKLVFFMCNGMLVKGDVNVTGYDRVSDFIQNEFNRFFEVFSVETGGYECDMLYVARCHTIWKKPVSS